jgi:hypothetical protein
MDAAALRAVIERDASRPLLPEAHAVAEHLRAHYGPVGAIVFYGSCLREGSGGGLLDFYVLVDTCRSVLPVFSAAWAWLLPPNVYYHEVAIGGSALRAKVAVMRLDQFLQSLSERAFSSTLSARFAQPAAIAFADSEATRERLIAGFCAAAATTIGRTLPLLAPTFTAPELWTRAFAESFAAELRPETPARRAAIVAHDAVRYEALCAAALGPPIHGRFTNTARGQRAAARRAWARRRIQGKALNALRLAKAAFTFRGGLDYAAWKIRRHSGVEIALTERDRARPLRAGLRLFVLALRRGAIR